MGHFAHAQQTLAGLPVEKPVPGFLTANIGDHRTLRYRVVVDAILDVIQQVGARRGIR